MPAKQVPTGGMQIFVEAYHFANTTAGWPAWRCMPRRPGRLARRGGAAKDEMASVAILNKVRGHVGNALNALVLC